MQVYKSDEIGPCPEDLPGPGDAFRDFLGENADIGIEPNGGWEEALMDKGDLTKLGPAIRLVPKSRDQLPDIEKVLSPILPTLEVFYRARTALFQQNTTK